MKKTNYAGNDMAMKCLNKSVVIINTTFQLLDIYADFAPLSFYLFFFGLFLFLLSYYTFVTLSFYAYFSHTKNSK